MSLIYYDIERSFTEYFSATLGTQAGEVIAYEFPLNELGSHTYSVEFVADTPIAVNGRAIDGTNTGRYIESLAQIDIFRLPTTTGEPDVAGAKKMLSRVTNLFKGSHFIPLKTYGSAPIGSTVGTVLGAIKIDELAAAKQAYDPNPAMRRYSQDLKLTTKETF